MATTISSGRANSPKLTANIADHGTIYGGRGLVFDGVTDYLTGTIGEEYSSLENFSLSVWTTVDTISDWRRVFILNSTSASVRFGIKSTGKMTFMPNSATGDINFTGTAMTTTGGWYHHVVTFEKATTTVKHYLNGALDYTKTDCTDTALDGAGTYVVGSFNGSALYWDGKISDLKLFDATLTEAQVQELYLKPEQSAPSAVRDNIFLWLPMCEGNPDSPQSIVYDHSEKKLGAEIISGSDWSTESGITVSNGSLIFDTSTQFNKATDTTAVSGKLYKVVYTISNYVSGSLRVRIGNWGEAKSANGTYTEYIISSSTSVLFHAYTDGSNDFTVSDISIKEVLMGNHATTNFFGDELHNGNWVDNSGDMLGFSSASARGFTAVNTDGNVGDNDNAAGNQTTLTAGKTYQISYTITPNSGVALPLNNHGLGTSVASYNTVAFDTTGTGSTSVQNISNTYTPTSTAGYYPIINVRANAAYNFTITNYSIKEVGISSSGFATADSEPTIPQVPLLRYNEKMVFDGYNDYVSLGDLDLIGTSDFTISFWVCAYNLPSNGYVIDKRGGSGAGYQIVLDGTTGKLSIHLNDGSDTFGMDGGTNISDGSLNFVCCVFDRSSNTNSIIYVNGMDDTDSRSGTMSDVGTLANNENLFIGAKNTSADFVNGIIDEVSVFNYALSATEVQELFNNGVALDANSHSKADNLLGYWRNDGISSWVDRTNIKAISFDGTDDKIAIDGIVNDINTQTGTINIWCMPITGSAGTDVVFSCNDNNARSDMMFRYNWDHNRIEAGLAQSGSQKWYTSSGTNSVSSHLNSWNMITLVHDGSAPICYVNGVDIEWTVSGTDHTFWFGDMSGVDKCAFGLWQYTSDDNEFLGYIGRSAVWDTNLSASQISAIYALGRHGDLTASYSSNLKGFYLMDKDYSTPDATGSNGIIDRSGTANHGTITGATFLGTNNGTPAGTPDSIVVREGLNSNKDGLGFPFKNDDRNVLRLNGVSEYLQIDDSDVFTFGNSTGDLPFSISAWIKMNDATNFTIFNKGVYNTDGEYNFRTNASDKLVFAVYDESVADTHESMVSDSAITTHEGSWIYVTGTYDGRGGTSANAGLKLYLNDAVLASTGSDNGTYEAMENLTGKPYIGKMDSSYANGIIDEVRVYNKELTLAEVQKNYKHGKGKHKN